MFNCCTKDSFVHINQAIVKTNKICTAYRCLCVVLCFFLPFGWTVYTAASCWGQSWRVCGRGDRGVCAKTELEATSHTPESSTLDTAAAPASFTNTHTRYDATGAHSWTQKLWSRTCALPQHVSRKSSVCSLQESSKCWFGFPALTHTHFLWSYSPHKVMLWCQNYRALKVHIHWIYI